VQFVPPATKHRCNVRICWKQLWWSKQHVTHPSSDKLKARQIKFTWWLSDKFLPYQPINQLRLATRFDG
jgi:hypothetical protein